MKKVILTIAVVVCLCIIATFMLNGSSPNSAVSVNSSAVNNVQSDKTESNGTSNNSTVTNGKSDNSDTAADSSKTVKNASGDNASSEKTNVEIGSAEGNADSTVTIPISIKSVPKNDIGSCNFSVKYDTSILEAVEVTPGDVIGKNVSNLDYSIIDSTGTVSFLFASSNDGKDSISKPGDFAKIKFKIKKDAKKGLTKITRELSGVFGDTSLKKVDAVFTQGGITVK